jgi:hypothetical protein
MGRRRFTTDRRLQPGNAQHLQGAVMRYEDMEDDRPRCVWCGSLGGYANRLYIYTDEDLLTLIAECEWCFSSDYFRKKAANGKGQ